MVTAKGYQQDQIKAMAAGAWDHVIKPWEADGIESKVNAREGVIRQHRQPSGEPCE